MCTPHPEYQATFLTSDHLTSAQRTLLVLILSAQNHRISQEKVQLLFWPEVSPGKAKNRFDKLISRLHSVLSNFLAPYPVHRYFGMRQGILYLETISFDAAERNSPEPNNGGRHLFFFHQALGLWQAPPEPELFEGDPIQEYFLDLSRKLSELASAGVIIS